MDSQIHHRARQRASELGVSLAEYVRRLVARDLARPQANADVACVFDLGQSGGADVAKNKDAMIAEVVQRVPKRSRAHFTGRS
jgi:hypothetical protein